MNAYFEVMKCPKIYCNNNYPVESQKCEPIFTLSDGQESLEVAKNC